MAITHTFVSQKPDCADTSLINPSNWNADHTIDIDLNELTDVTITSHDINDIIMWNGSAWVDPDPCTAISNFRP